MSGNEQLRGKRPNRSAAQRRAQQERANARVTQSLLRQFESLNHRGCTNGKLGAALQRALSGGELSEQPVKVHVDATQIEMLQIQVAHLEKIVGLMYTSQHQLIEFLRSRASPQDGSFPKSGSCHANGTNNETVAQTRSGILNPDAQPFVPTSGDGLGTGTENPSMKQSTDKPPPSLRSVFGNGLGTATENPSMHPHLMSFAERRGMFNKPATAGPARTSSAVADCFYHWRYHSVDPFESKLILKTLIQPTLFKASADVDTASLQFAVDPHGSFISPIPPGSHKCGKCGFYHDDPEEQLFEEDVESESASRFEPDPVVCPSDDEDEAQDGGDSCLADVSSMGFAAERAVSSSFIANPGLTVEVNDEDILELEQWLRSLRR